MENFKKMNCPICNSDLTIDSFGLFCPNESCCYISEIPNVANEDSIPLLYENDKLIKWIKVDSFSKSWYVNGQLHREDGPAVEYSDGIKYWYLNGKLHRENGPAVEYPDGTKAWYLNNKRHRTDGPAVEYSDGTKYWYYDGRPCS